MTRIRANAPGLRSAPTFPGAVAPDVPAARHETGSPRPAGDCPRFASAAADSRPRGRRADEPRRGFRGLRGALRRFRTGERGGVAIETAIALAVLVSGFASVIEIVHVSYTDDTIARAARAAARSLALNPASDACAPIRSELDLAVDFDCNAAWTLTVYRGVLPSALQDALGGTVTEGTGDMVLVQIDWNRAAWSFGGVVPDADAADDTEETTSDAAETETDTKTDTKTVPMVAIGLARCEQERCGQSSS